MKLSALAVLPPPMVATLNLAYSMSGHRQYGNRQALICNSSVLDGHTHVYAGIGACINLHCILRNTNHAKWFSACQVVRCFCASACLGKLCVGQPAYTLEALKTKPSMISPNVHQSHG